MTKKQKYSVIGKRIPKIEGLDKVTGHAIFVDDMKLPRMVYAKILRSPHPHAIIRSIDTSKAEAHPGVLAVMTGKELPIKYGILPSSQDENVLAIDKVRYIGDEVAAVAAIDEETAEEALELIEVDYEVLAPVLSIEDALREDLPMLHENPRRVNNLAKKINLDFGNVDEGIEEADYVLEENYLFEANTHVPLETHGAIGDWAPDGRVTVWSSTQTPHYLHREISKIFEIPRSHVRIIKPHIGSGFGGKSEPFALEFCVAWLSKKCGRPVKLIYTREEVFYAYRGRHAIKMWLKVGVKNDGRITAIDYKSWLDGGAYGSYGIVTTYYSGQFLTLPYKVQNFRFEAQRLYTNKPAAGPKRGHGSVQPRFAIETHLDKIAEHLGLDPVEMRIKNSVEPNSITVNSLRITSCGFVEACEQAAEKLDWKNKFGKLPYGKGVGFAGSTYISGAGKPIYWNDMPHSGVVTKIDRGGGVAVFCGASDIGQGSDSMLAYVTAEILGVRPIDVRVCQTDTDLTPVDMGSYSSRVTFMAGNAAIDAAEKLKKLLLDVASEHLKVPQEDLELADNEIFSAKDPSICMGFIDCVVLAETKHGTLSAPGSYTPPNLGGTYKGAGAGPSPAYSFTTAAAEVDVDVETGEIKVHNIVTAHDCGKALNPIICEGQIEGSAYMGFGEAVLEVQRITKKGLFWTPSLLEYKIPTIYDTPELSSILVESDDPEGPFGAKESGEGPLAPSIPAIVNAVYDAIGVRLNEVPITPERVLKAIEEKKKADALALKNGHSNRTHKKGKVEKKV